MTSEVFDQVGKVIYLEKKKMFSSNTKPIFWGVASGKGGIGRSFFTSSLGITLSRAGYRVLMVDCDQHGGNLHSWMGTYSKDKNLSDYFRNIDDVDNYILPLSHEKISLLSGNTCLWNCDGGTVRNVSDLLEELRSKPYDIVLFDLSAGFEQNNLEIIRKMDNVFLMATPEGASIEKTYRWIENYLMNVHLTPENKAKLCEFNQSRRGSKQSENLFSVRDFLENMCCEQFGERKMFGPLKLIVNQARNFEDDRLGESIKSICNKYYFTDIQYIGSLQYDNAVWQCARQRVPVLVHQPFNPLVGQIQGLVKQLVDQYSERAVV